MWTNRIISQDLVNPADLNVDYRGAPLDHAIRRLFEQVGAVQSVLCNCRTHESWSIEVRRIPKVLLGQDLVAFALESKQESILVQWVDLSPAEEHEVLAALNPRELPAENRKPTKEEHRERVEVMADLILRHPTDGEVKKLFRERFGNVHHQTIGRYMVRARELNASRLTISTTERKQEVTNILFFHLLHIACYGKTEREQIRAIQQIARMFGLNEPIKFMETDEEGKSVYRRKLANLDPSEFASVRRIMESLN